MTIQSDKLPIFNGDLGWAFGCSRRGAAHIQSEVPCQDAYSIWSGAGLGTPCLIAAVADGHGDSRHDLSQYGAWLAVEAAVHELSSFHLNFGVGGVQVLKNSFRADFPRKVGQRWHRYVLENLKAREGNQATGFHQEQPLGGVDTKKSGKEELPDFSDKIRRIFTRYGTTLLTASVSVDTILIGQIGDGDILLIRPDRSIEYPLQRDLSAIGNATYSLSSRDAPNLWKTAALENERGGLLLMTTDGLVNAFEEDQFIIFARSLLDRIEEFGIPKIAASMPHWLDNYSEKGSGDDITLTLVYISP